MGAFKTYPRYEDEPAAGDIDPSGIMLGKYEPDRFINLTQLSIDARSPDATIEDSVAWNMTWQCIKRNQPALAEQIKSPEVSEIISRFNASVLLDCESINKSNEK